MALQTNIITATLKTNLNNKVTSSTKNYLPSTQICNGNNIEARTLGIKGADGGGTLITFKGNFDINGNYTLNDIVYFNGASYIYINVTDNIHEVPENSLTVWSILTGFKTMNIMVDELVNGDIIVGQALPDSLETDLNWSIKKIVFNGEDVSIRYAENTSSFNKSWDLRLTYNY